MKNMSWILLLCGVTCLAQVPGPAPAQEKPIALVGGTAHLGTGEVIANAVIAFEDGKLTTVADQATARIDRSRFTVIDTTGKHIYPGFIMPAVDLGLGEVNSVRATIDNAETGSVNPNVRAIVAYNTDSEVIPTYRFNGILMAQTTPTGGLVSGQSSVVQLDAWNWEDAAYRTDEGLHVNWPGRMRRQFDFATFTVQTVPNERYQENMDLLGKLFADARAYGAGTPERRNLALEAVLGLFDGSKTLYIHTNDAKSMIAGVKFAEQEGVAKVAVVGGRQALMVHEFLVEHDIPVILTDIHATPSTAHGDIDEAYKRAAAFHEAGIRFCFGYNSRTNARNLGFTAGTAVAYGLPYEQAVRAVTLATAEILGIDETTGSLEVGKDATLFVSEGDAFDMRTQILSHAFIQGRNLDLYGRQQALFDRYRDKYGHDE